MTVFLAHGALGYWDELIFLSIAIAFLVMMGVSWLRERGEPAPAPPEEAASPDSERFTLD